MKLPTRPVPGCLLAALLLAGSAQAINLGGRDVPQDRFIVFLAVGHSNMCGRVDDIDTGTYATHPRVWNYKFDDGTDAWILAQPPVHRDASWQRGGGPATPFLKELAAAHPGYYFGVIQNAHSSVTCQADYRRGRTYYDEIVAVASPWTGQVTLGGVLCMLGAMEARNLGLSQDFGNQITGMLNEMRADLSEPGLPLLINRLTRGDTHWQVVQNNIALLPSQLSFTDIVPSDGPYKPNDNVHFTWVGHQAWGQAAASLLDANGWLPVSGPDNFSPLVDTVRALDGTAVEIGFDEGLDPATAGQPSRYTLNGGVSVTGATLAADGETVTLITSAMTPGTIYTLTVDGVEDISGNPTANLVTTFVYTQVDIPRQDLAMWLSAGDGVVRISGNFVPLWADLSGRGNEVIRARFANQPLWLADQVNGEPALNFQGPHDPEQDWMNRVLPAATSGDATLFFVFRLDSLGQTANASLFSSSDAGGEAASYQIEVDGLNPGTLQLFTDSVYPVGPATTNWTLLSVRIAGTSLDFYVNAQAAGSFGIGASEAKAYTQYQLAANRALGVWLAADIAEVLLYEQALPPAERLRVEQYLGGKYGLVTQPAGIRVNPTGGLVTTEPGGADTFTVVLDSIPGADVSVPVSSSDTSEGLADVGSVTFSAGNWDQPRTVTVTGVDDANQDGPVAYQVVLSPATSADAAYDGIDPPDVGVTNMDDDGAQNLPPTAVISGPDSTNVAILVSYFGGNSTDDGTIVRYDWDFGDSSTDSGQQVSYLWSTPAVYTVTLTVTDDGGLTDAATLDVSVLPELAPHVDLQSPLGGEVWPAGSTQHILWSTNNLDDIRIDFSEDGGANWVLVDYSDVNDATWGDYAWTLPDIESHQCVITVQGYNFEAPAQSGLFTITRGNVPDGGTQADEDDVPDAGGSSESGEKISGGCGCSSSVAGFASYGGLVSVSLVISVRRRGRSRSSPCR